MFYSKLIYFLSSICLINIQAYCRYVFSARNDQNPDLFYYQTCNQPYKQVLKNMSNYLLRPCLIKHSIAYLDELVSPIDEKKRNRRGKTNLKIKHYFFNCSFL
jgi:hypothetical protein